MTPPVAATTVLGIETSCDETAAAVVRRAADGRGSILSNVKLLPIVGARRLITGGMVLASWPPAGLYGFVLTGLFLAPVFPTALSWVVRVDPAAGAATALVIAGASFGPVLVSPLIGLTHDRFGAAAIAPALAAVIVLDLALALGLRRDSRGATSG